MIIMQTKKSQFWVVTKITGFSTNPTSSYVHLFQISPPTMVTLEADGAPPQPLHPTMPPYTSRETYLHSSEPKFQVE